MAGRIVACEPGPLLACQSGYLRPSFGSMPVRKNIFAGPPKAPIFQPSRSLTVL